MNAATSQESGLDMVQVPKVGRIRYRLWVGLFLEGVEFFRSVCWISGFWGGIFEGSSRLMLASRQA